MNTYLKEKIVNLFDRLKLSANLKTITQYQNISIHYNLFMIGLFSFIEGQIFSLFWGHGFDVFIGACYINVVMFYLIFREFKTQKFFPQLRRRIFNYIKPVKEIEATYHYIEDKIAGALSNIEQQFLFLSFFDNYRDKYAQSKSKVLRNRSITIDYKIKDLKKSLDKNDFSKASEQCMDLIFFISINSEVNAHKLETIPYTEHDKKLLAVKNKYMAEFLNGNDNFDTMLEYEKEELEIEINGKQPLFTQPVKKIDWNKVI